MLFGAVNAEAEGSAVGTAEDAVTVDGGLLGEVVVFTHECHVVSGGLIYEDGGYVDGTADGFLGVGRNGGK